MDRKPLSLRCYPEQYSTSFWPPAMCSHSCIRQELACYRLPLGVPPKKWQVDALYLISSFNWIQLHHEGSCA